MSIYATLWSLKFPRFGEDHAGCEWVEVVAQGVPEHIGTPTPGHGYEDGDPYASFLPPAIPVDEDATGLRLRAVVFVLSGTPKDIVDSPQEYRSPLLVMTGAEYESARFEDLYQRLCAALRGDRPPCTMRMLTSDGRVQALLEDGSVEWSRWRPSILGEGLSKKALLSVLAAVPALLRLPWQWLEMDHDQGADVLYLSFRKPKLAKDSELLEDGIVIDTDGDEIVGVTIMDAAARGRGSAETPSLP